MGKLSTMESGVKTVVEDLVLVKGLRAETGGTWDQLVDMATLLVGIRLTIGQCGSN